MKTVTNGRSHAIHTIPDFSRLPRYSGFDVRYLQRNKYSEYFFIPPYFLLHSKVFAKELDQGHFEFLDGAKICFSRGIVKTSSIKKGEIVVPPSQTKIC